MSESNVKAEAILIVIKTILKWIGIAIVGIGILLYLVFQYQEYEGKQRRKIEDKVSIQAFHPKDAPCSKDFPYQYTIFNDSGRTVEKVSFTVGVKRIGFSSDINRYTSIDEDKILLNNEGYGRCFRVEDVNDYGKYLSEKDVNIEVTYKNITFKE